MVLDRTWKRAGALVALAAALVVVGCGGGDDDGDASGGEKVTLSFLVDNSDQAVKPAEALIKAFQAKNPDITIKLETRPQGGEGDNVVKTRLSTQEMTDIFAYNSGSLFQALNPASQLTPLNDEPWVGRPRRRVQAERVGRGPGLRRAVRQRLRRRASSTTRRSTQSSAWRSRRRGTSSWRTTPRSRRPASTRSSRATGHLDLAAVRARRLPQRRRPRTRTGPSKYTSNQVKYSRSRPSRASSTSRRSTRPAT